ncbi:MAG TPA: ATP-dependent helicase, partial [Thermodesulfobacteriota bacterium]|nr:ATP-dependent helicase [Thermodesulfobacteriota bacterium]
GRYADSRLRELRPRLSIDRLDNTVRGRAGVLRLIYLSGGTIPDRGYYDLRLAETGGKIGELDEEFVWERRIGDTFPLGTQVWRIKKITHNDVEVLPAEALPGIIPFWRAEDRNRDFYFSEKILHFLEEVQDRPEDKSLKNDLCRKYFMEPEAAEALMEYLRAQRAATGKRLPHRHHLVIEHIRDPLSQNQRVVLHTLWGGRINRPLSLALEAAWEERYGEHLEILQNNDCLLLMHPPNFSARELVTLVTPENVERFLRQSLEKSGFFGARFRENAGRALLLPRSDFRRRLPLWLNRLRSKNLLERIAKYPDFPILLETWRTCLRDEFDMVHLKELIEDLQEGRIQVSEAYTQSPSPFAGSLVWKQTNTHMYADDSSLAARPSQLTQEWLKEVLFSHQLRPRIPGDLVSALDARLQRTAPGYAPRSAEELLDWIKERVFIPWPEWQELLGAINRDHLLGEGEVLPGIFEKIVFLILPGASICMVCAVELLGRIAAAFQIPADALRSGEIIRPETFKGRTPSYIHKILDRHISTEESEEEKDLTEVFLQWLSFYGPVSTSFLRESLGLEGNLLDDSLASLAEAQEIVLDRLTENAEFPEICLRENLEILLRMARRARQPSFEPRPLEELPLFLAAFQGLTQKGNSAEDLQKVLDRLFGFTTGADAWEKTILPARLSPYHGFWLDDLMSAGPLVWFGCGKQKTSFMLMEDSPLFLEYDGIPPRPGEDIGSQADEVGGV